jgi:hypothetical protein
MTSGGGALRGREPTYLVEVRSPQRRIGCQQDARVPALVAKPTRPLLLVPGDDHAARLGGKLANAERKRDLRIEHMAEHLGGGPFPLRGPAPEAASRGPAEDAPKRARRRRESAEDVTPAEPVVGHSTDRARHLVVSSSWVMPYNSAP